MGSLYLILSIVCRFYFYHHPAHVGVRIIHGRRDSSKRGPAAAGNFFLETMTPG